MRTQGILLVRDTNDILKIWSEPGGEGVILQQIWNLNVDALPILFSA